MKRVRYNDLEWLVAEEGEDGSVVLTPTLQSGPKQRQPGELELTAEQARTIIPVCTYHGYTEPPRTNPDCAQG